MIFDLDATEITAGADLFTLATFVAWDEFDGVRAAHAFGENAGR